MENNIQMLTQQNSSLASRLDSLANNENNNGGSNRGNHPRQDHRPILEYKSIQNLASLGTDKVAFAGWC